jgi:hypothetical protein
MPVVYPGATLTPHFRDFLPEWVSRQTWFRGGGPTADSPLDWPVHGCLAAIRELARRRA